MSWTDWTRTLREYYRECRERFDAILFDADGTLSVCGTPLPGASELLERLNADGFPYLLLTNDASHSCRRKAELQQRAGLPIREEQILSSGDALIAWARQNYHGELFFQAGTLGTPGFAELAGIRITQDPRMLDSCAGVLMGEGRYDWQPAWEGVFNFLLRRPEVPLVVPNPDSCWKSRGEGYGFGSGAPARFLCGLLKEVGVEKEPVYLGKPYDPVYRCAFARLERQFPVLAPLCPERVLMVGDLLDSDILGGNRNGLTSCLVLTGVSSMAMASAAAPERRPRLIFCSV